ncbi:hypothetical protein ACF06Q_09175 [Streptomyces leeuwenhoekii]|uniref:hypothetical protein n=1 Tax=Streptomyces leeuwenhoekii TaxID=1437453 RepID=UPI0036FCBA32
MAAICPNCHQPEAVAYVINEDGLYPFTCMECDASVIRSTPRGTLIGSVPCPTGGCTGSVRDAYVYDSTGRLTQLNRHRCLLCGTDQTRKAPHAADHREHAVPDPRMLRIAGRRV